MTSKLVEFAWEVDFVGPLYPLTITVVACNILDAINLAVLVRRNYSHGISERTGKDMIDWTSNHVKMARRGARVHTQSVS